MTKTLQHAVHLEGNPFVPLPYKVLDFLRETQDNFTLTVNMKIAHAPGQFVQLSIPGFGEAPISISSYSKKFVMLNVREVGTVTHALANLRKGDTILLRGPYGKGYPMESLRGNSLLVIGGGCGVAPLRGVIDYIDVHRADYKDIFLFLGYRSPDDVLFKHEIEEWKKKFLLFMSVDANAHGQFCYDAKVGFITDVLRNTHITTEKKVVFICGPPAMMQRVIDVLIQKGFHDDQIFVSAERLMYCAFGVCCHCMIRGKFTCIDGPVFRYDEIKNFKND